MDNESVMKVRDDYCVGHLSYHIPEWCPRCMYDEKNHLCLGYRPINLTLIEIMEKKEESRLPSKSQ